MAKPKPEATKILVNVDLPLEEVVYHEILNMVDDASISDGRKIGGVALNCLNELAAGAVVVTGEEIENIRQNTGIEIEEPEEFLAYIQEATGRKNGMLMVPYFIDPADQPPLQEIADMRGCPIAEVVTDVLDFVRDNGMVHNIAPEKRAQAVLMTPAQKLELETMMGGTFETGTDLYHLIKKFNGADDLFNEVYAEAAPAVVGVR
jgi:hypothetical protein